MVDDLECFDLVYCATFIVLCVGTRSHSQKGQFLASFCQIFCLSFILLVRGLAVRGGCTFFQPQPALVRCPDSTVWLGMGQAKSKNVCLDSVEA